MIWPMSLLSLKDVTHAYGGPPLLDRVDLRIEAGERIGLLGRNGAGKTTLLRILTGELVADGGEVVLGRGTCVTGLAQELPDELAGTVREHLVSAAASRPFFLHPLARLCIDCSVSRCSSPSTRRLTSSVLTYSGSASS